MTTDTDPLWSPDDTGPEVSAYVKTDDDGIEQAADISLLLMAMSDSEVEALLEAPEPGEITDDLYWALLDRDDEAANAISNYIDENPINPDTEEDMGFSVRVDEDELRAWVKAKRPALIEDEAPTP